MIFSAPNQLPYWLIKTSVLFISARMQWTTLTTTILNHILGWVHTWSEYTLVISCIKLIVHSKLIRYLICICLHHHAIAFKVTMIKFS